MRPELSVSNLLHSPRGSGLVAALGALALDQGSKYWVLHVFDTTARQPVRLTPFLDLVLSWNHGISYSLFAAHEAGARWALLGLQATIIAGLALWLWRAGDRLVATALGLIIGGALGNAFDRLFRGAVADFLFLHTEWPVGPLANYVFNAADAAITLGVAMLLLESFRARPEGEAGAEKSAARQEIAKK